VWSICSFLSTKRTRRLCSWYKDSCDDMLSQCFYCDTFLFYVISFSFDILMFEWYYVTKFISKFSSSYGLSICVISPKAYRIHVSCPTVVDCFIFLFPYINCLIGLQCAIYATFVPRDSCSQYLGIYIWNLIGWIHFPIHYSFHTNHTENPKTVLKI